MFDVPHRLHPAAIIIRFGTVIVGTLRALVPAIAALFLAHHDQTRAQMTLYIECAVAGLALLGLIGPLLYYFSTTFYIQDDALIINSGFVWKKHSTIPLARIQNVNIERTLWHRLLGAAAVKVETATGHKSEANLAALSVENADKLQHVLLHRQEALAEEPVEAKPTALYQLSLKQVLLAGALGNRAIYIFAGLFAALQADGFRTVAKPISDAISRLGPVASALAATGIFFGLILLGWLFSIIFSATRYYGFRIERHEKGLLLSHGLITQFQAVVPLGRIQMVRVVQPMLYRLLGYCELYADTAGSFDKKDQASANKVCPIIREGGVAQIGKLLMPEFEFEGLLWNSVSRWTILRQAWGRLFAVTIVFSVPLGMWLKWSAVWLLIPVAAWGVVMGALYFKFVGYAFTRDLLVSRQGVFRREAKMIPFDRIQHYTIQSSPLQRQLGLATVSAVSAAAGRHQISVVDVEAESAQTLRQRIGEAISSHLGSRRGGL